MTFCTALITVMKVAVLLALAALLSPILAQETVSSDAAVKLGMEVYLEFLNKTGTGDECGKLACCPCIIQGGPKGSVIQPFTGYRGNAAIIVDWGSEEQCGPRPPWKRACTPADKGFIWFVDWGDGTYTYNYSIPLGPFQTTHTYKPYVASYGVKAMYCSAPKYGHRCCDVKYQVIDVSYDPENPRPDVFGN